MRAPGVPRSEVSVQARPDAFAHHAPPRSQLLSSSETSYRFLLDGAGVRPSCEHKACTVAFKYALSLRTEPTARTESDACGGEADCDKESAGLAAMRWNLHFAPQATSARLIRQRRRR
jgi:hypothetical protein